MYQVSHIAPAARGSQDRRATIVETRPRAFGYPTVVQLEPVVSDLLAAVEIKDKGATSALPAANFERYLVHFGDGQATSMNELVSLVAAADRAMEGGLSALATQLVALLKQGLRALGASQDALNAAVRAAVPTGPQRTPERDLDRPRVAPSISMRPKGDTQVRHK